MIEALYTNGWGAFVFLLMMQIPFLLIFFHIVNKKTFVDPEPAKTSPEKYSKYRYAWIAVAIGVFIVVNAASINYMPTIVEAKAATAPNVQDVSVTARAWAFEFSDTEFKVGDTIRIKAHSVDTVHSFALYHPEGDLLFTMMLLPSAGTDSAVIHTFDEPGEYTIRCLEYCGIAHHNMKRTFTVI